MNLIRKFVLPVLLCAVAALAPAQTPVSGTFTVGSAAVASGSVTFALQNCGTTPTAGSATYSATLNSSGVIGLGCTKSKRNRSGATSEPRWAMWSPSTCRSASCSRCVAE